MRSGYEFSYAKAGRIKELWDHIYGVFGDWMDQGPLPVF